MKMHKVTQHVEIEVVRGHPRSSAT